MATGVIPFLIEPESVEERVYALILEFNATPHLINPFRKMIASLQNKEIMGSIEEQIRFFQTTQCRNYLFVNQFNEVLNCKELKLDLETGRLPGAPAELLKYASTAREEFGSESRYKNIMFSIGLFFDFLSYMTKTEMLNLGGGKFDELIDACFKKGVAQGKIVAKVTRHIPKIPNDVLIPAVPLLRQLGQVALSLLNPGKAPDLYKKFEELRYTEPLKIALEKKEFGIHSNWAGALIAQSIPILDPLGEMMSVIGVNHLAHYTKNKNIHDSSSAAALVINLTEGYKIGEIPDGANIGAYIPELKFFETPLAPKIKEEFKEAKS